MALLGSFREAFDKIRFRMRATAAVNPATVFMLFNTPDEAPQSIPVAEDVDSDGIGLNEYRSTIDVDLTNKNLGIGVVQYGAVNFSSIAVSKADTVRVISSYGRNYGEDYGNGL